MTRTPRRPSTLDPAQERALRGVAKRLQDELGLDDDATCLALGSLLSDVPPAEVIHQELVKGEHDRLGRPVTRSVGREHDGYAPEWLMASLNELVSPRRLWVDGIERFGLGPGAPLEDLRDDDS